MIAVEWIPRVNGNAFKVLYAIATYADPDSKAFPSVATLSKVTGISVRAVQTALRELEEAVAIITTIRYKTSNMYELQAPPTHNRNANANATSRNFTPLVVGRGRAAVGHDTSIHPDDDLPDVTFDMRATSSKLE